MKCENTNESLFFPKIGRVDIFRIDKKKCTVEKKAGRLQILAPTGMSIYEIRDFAETYIRGIEGHQID